jgi:DNA-binding transcriptional regulator YiaG
MLRGGITVFLVRPGNSGTPVFIQTHAFRSEAAKIGLTAEDLSMAKNKKVGLSKAGKKIVAGLQEIAEALESGVPLEQRFTVREVIVPEPGSYNAKAVRTIRTELGLSQSLFAHLMGISVILEQAWEQGRRFPNATARRLLDEIRHDPQRWIAMLEPAKAA